jgi:hypothetical protein
MPYADYSSMFVDQNGKALSTAQVPESCIDSAEYIMRRIADPNARQTRNRTGKSILAKFSNRTFNASKDDFMKFNLQGLQSHAFTGLPEVGQGIILLNKTNNDLQYNMHLGAIVAKEDRRAVISHMYQEVRSYTYKPLKVIDIISVDDFARKTFDAQANCYAAGLLTVDAG